MFKALIGCILYIRPILAAIRTVIKYLIDTYILGIPCSYPGDAKENPLMRRGKWEFREFIPGPGYKFACDVESHKISQKSAPKYKMTGETAGRQIWYYDDKETKDWNEISYAIHNSTDYSFNASKNPNSGDKIFREAMIKNWKGKKPNINHEPQDPLAAAVKGMEFYQMLQCSDGHWAGDYGGPMFLMPGLITTLYITKAPFPQWKKDAMITYLLNHQQEDGGWGTHIECASTMFGTILSYVALRLLGEGPDEDYMKAGLKFIHHYGGALYAPSWAKFWLAALGVYDWDGINSIPAEMWLLPRWFPFHPGKMWCHARMVYLPMCYVYCKRFTPDVSSDPLLQSLREELYLEPYNSIVWDDFRQTCAPIDEYSPLNPVMKIAQDICSWYEWLLPKFSLLQKLRKYALDFVIEYIHAEDIQTNYVDIGPVNKALNMLCVWVDADMDNKNENFQRHIPRVDDYLWVAEDGMKMQGYNGSQCWDTSFAIQAIVEGELAELFPECARKVYEYMDRTQIKQDEDNREHYYRHVSKGGWPFSTAAHGWPISDCTSEGLKAVLCLHKKGMEGVIPPEMRISDQRLCEACDIVLSYHNEDGGWATYENNRGFRWYELLNPSEVFGDIMIDYSYVECSSACITALKEFSSCVPTYRSAEVVNAIKAGGDFLKSIQRTDGSWYGSWGVCFLYGTWFGITGLVAAGEPVDSPNIRQALKYILSKQNPNGGWGESYVACVNKDYPPDGAGPFGRDGSGVVQTAWAILGLVAGKCQDSDALRRGIRYIMSRQLPSGDWAQEGITGVFNRSCGITYTAYRNVFPIWALSAYHKSIDYEE